MASLAQKTNQERGHCGENTAAGLTPVASVILQAGYCLLSQPMGSPMVRMEGLELSQSVAEELSRLRESSLIYCSDLALWLSLSQPPCF